jgi:diaminohydroxyphosphoribosylaminopyrimidine deaminase/5-amino-6-(5-phosphoribosylamino)uracil reductase
VIVDSRLRIPLRAKVLKQGSAARTIIATLANAPKSRIRKLQQLGAEVLIARSSRGRVDLRDLMKKLGERGIMSLLIEGGAEVNASALKAGIVDKVVFFIAPMLMRRDALPSIGGARREKLKHAMQLRDVTVRPSGRT